MPHCGTNSHSLLPRPLAPLRPSSPSVLDGFSEESPLHQGHHQERDEDEHRHDGGVAESEVFEGRVIQQHDDGLAGAGRSALGRGVHLIEDLEVEDEFEDADHEDLRVEQGKRDVAELLERIGPVDAGRLVILLRDRLERGQEDHGVEADPDPDAHDGDGRAHLEQALQPLLGRNADERQGVVQEAIDRVVDPLPDEGGRDQRGGEGQEVHGGPDVPPREAGDPVETERHRQGADHRDGHGHQQELDGVLDGGPEGGVGEDLFIEAQAHELARSAWGDPVERVHDGLGERQDEDGAEEQQGGEDEQESRPPLAVHVALGERDAKPVAHGSREPLIGRSGDRAIGGTGNLATGSPSCQVARIASLPP